MKKIAFIGMLAALALLLSGCVVVSWKGAGQRKHSLYVSARSPRIIQVIQLPDPQPRHPQTPSPWDNVPQ